MRLLLNTGVSGALGRLPTILPLRGLPLGLLWLRNHLVYDLLCRGCYTYAYAYDMRNVCMIYKIYKCWCFLKRQFMYRKRTDHVAFPLEYSPKVYQSTEQVYYYA